MVDVSEGTTIQTSVFAEIASVAARVKTAKSSLTGFHPFIEKKWLIAAVLVSYSIVVVVPYLFVVQKISWSFVFVKTRKPWFFHKSGPSFLWKPAIPTKQATRISGY
jgi:hypothetical protein